VELPVGGVIRKKTSLVTRQVSGSWWQLLLGCLGFVQLAGQQPADASV